MTKDDQMVADALVFLLDNEVLPNKPEMSWPEERIQHRKRDHICHVAPKVIAMFKDLYGGDCKATDTVEMSTALDVPTIPPGDGSMPLAGLPATDEELMDMLNAGPETIRFNQNNPRPRVEEMILQGSVTVDTVTGQPVRGEEMVWDSDVDRFVPRSSLYDNI